MKIVNFSSHVELTDDHFYNVKRCQSSKKSLAPFLLVHFDLLSTYDLNVEFFHLLFY